MSESQISMVLRIHPPAAAREQLKAALRALVEPSRREQGCIRYELYQDIDKEGDFILLECWRDQAALDEHFAKPYLKDFSARFADVLRDAVTSGLTRLAAL